MSPTWTDPIANIGTEGAIIISGSLKGNTSLTELDLSGENSHSEKEKNGWSICILLANKIWGEGAVSLSESLVTNTSLVRLDLSGD